MYGYDIRFRIVYDRTLTVKVLYVSIADSVLHCLSFIMYDSRHVTLLDTQQLSSIIIDSDNLSLSKVTLTTCQRHKDESFKVFDTWQLPPVKFDIDNLSLSYLDVDNLSLSHFDIDNLSMSDLLYKSDSSWIPRGCASYMYIRATFCGLESVSQFTTLHFTHLQLDTLIRRTYTSPSNID